MSLQVASTTKDLYCIAIGEQTVNPSIKRPRDAVKILLTIQQTWRGTSKALSVFFMPLFVFYALQVFLGMSLLFSSSSKSPEAFVVLIESLGVLLLILLSLSPAAELNAEMSKFRQLVSILGSQSLDPTVHRSRFLPKQHAPSSGMDDIATPWAQLLYNLSPVDAIDAIAPRTTTFSAVDIEYMQWVMVGAAELLSGGIVLFGYTITYGSLGRLASGVVPIYAFALQYMFL
jgi:hypothetical protein